MKICRIIPLEGLGRGARETVSLGKPHLLALVLLAAILLPATAACGARSAPAPRIGSLSAGPGLRDSKPIDITARVVDSSTGRAVALAHASYGRQVAQADSNGTFGFKAVPPEQTLAVVAAGYRRYAAPWNPNQHVIRLTPFEVHALYVPFLGLSNPASLVSLDRHTDQTEINAVVVEVKTDDGHVSPEMATPAARETHAVAGEDGELRAFIDKMHGRGIYVIGRFVVFRDPTLSVARPELALHYADGRVYQDEQGVKWIDASRDAARQYNIDLAEKAAQVGLDEIQFDYVRFPGAVMPLANAQQLTEENRVAAIGSFLKEAEARLRPYGVAIAADSFGQTTIATDDTGIGQDIAVLGQYLDYYCPMVYPSTWAVNSFELPYPPADPYKVVLDSVQSAVQRLAARSTVRVRPWLQAFDDYQARKLAYTPAMVNTQKDAAASAGATGWMLWHPTSQYDDAVIRRLPTIADSR